jgi:hypothetical protein
MKLRFQLLTVCLLIFPSIVLADWVALLKNVNEDVIYYDPKMIVENGSQRHVKMYSNYYKPKSDGQNRIASSMMHLAIDCKRKTFSVLQLINFDDYNLQGSQSAKNFPYPKINSIPDKSSISEIEKVICTD